MKLRSCLGAKTEQESIQSRTKWNEGRTIESPENPSRKFYLFNCVWEDNVFFVFVVKCVFIHCVNTFPDPQISKLHPTPMESQPTSMVLDSISDTIVGLILLPLDSNVWLFVTSRAFVVWSSEWNPEKMVRTPKPFKMDPNLFLDHDRNWRFYNSKPKHGDTTKSRSA